MPKRLYGVIRPLMFRMDALLRLCSGTLTSEK